MSRKSNAPGREAEGVECLRAGDIDANTANHMNLQPGRGLAGYQALRLIQEYSIRPELAVMLAALAFGGSA